MNGNWKINRVGLIDFWYYDEEEFDFLDGRMLLRGANGSGKSVTMQSFIPLLLDGNMRPERLDPFGSRARKMENYLLEEGDEREERTGYLYMEFCRKESGEYLTLGIGLRARKNKKLESWYFCITDGRRVGRDLFLYKDLDTKITCSRTELKNRIGEGGRVMETQGEYAQCVNRLLFGFETTEEYRELLELLIQLRTPKLSKDFKPSVVNEILSSSLQTLSEDDLRPMSEAIENMDSLKTNLDTLNDSIQAARQIERIYDQYNQIVLYDKALLFTKAAKDLEDCERAGTELVRKLLENEESLKSERQHYEDLKREEEVLREEKKSLDQSDAAKLKEEEVQLAAGLSEEQKSLAEKRRQEQEKKERQTEAERQIRKGEEQNESLWQEIEEHLEEMEAELGEVPFDEFAFLKKELCEGREKPYGFSAHQQLLNEYVRKVRAGKELLSQEKGLQERYDRALLELDRCREERSRAEREVQQYERLLEETKAELTEQAYLWEKANQELRLEPETLQEISREIAEYRMGSDYSEIRELVKPRQYQLERSLGEERLLLEKGLREKRQELEEAGAELLSWQNQKDPEPEQPERVRENRRLLKEQGIPCLQFYKTIDFDQSLSEEQKNRLEEALLEMGVLDALLVPEEYRERVYALDPGVCDRYIFSDLTHVRQNLMEVLEVDNAENDILLYQSISHVLSSVGFGGKGAERGDSWVDAQGNYRLGVLEGTVSKQYTARFIGVRAREKYRQEQIAAYTELVRRLSEEAEGLEEKLRENAERAKRLASEWESFPGEQDLKTAAKELADREYALELKTGRLKEQQERTEEERKALDELRLRVRETCAKCYLPPRLDTFEEALEALQRYQELLTKLQAAHVRFQNGIEYVKSRREYAEETSADLDDIRYELGRMVLKARELEEKLASVRSQLALTDYEAIRERLDHCILRLQSLPGEREASIGRQSALKETGKVLQEKSLETRKRKEELSGKRERAGRIFEAEYRLGYVEKNSGALEDREERARKICQLLAGSFGSRKQSELLGSLQGAYHQNRSYLLEYHITLQTLFEELDEESGFLEAGARRIDITAKYRGTPVSFQELLERLLEDAQNLERILSDRDRELFEDILANTISKKIRSKIQNSRRWVEKMNRLMDSMQTSSGLKLSLRWKSRRAEKEEQLDTSALVELLQKDVEIMRPEEVESLSAHFRSKISEARRLSGESGSVQSFHAVMREVLDYRQWFEFQLECQKTGEKKKELTDRVFFTFSGGEKAMAMYVPLFSAVAAKYAGARPEAPRLISLDEAFAGVDETNIRDMFRLMVEFRFNFMINSQILWGDYDTVPGLAIYQLIRPENAKFVTVIRYIWNGKAKVMVTGNGELEADADAGT